MAPLWAFLRPVMCRFLPGFEPFQGFATPFPSDLPTPDLPTPKFFVFPAPFAPDGGAQCASRAVFGGIAGPFRTGDAVYTKVFPGASTYCSDLPESERAAPETEPLVECDRGARSPNRADALECPELAGSRPPAFGGERGKAD